MIVPTSIATSPEATAAATGPQTRHSAGASFADILTRQGTTSDGATGPSRTRPATEAGWGRDWAAVADRKLPTAAILATEGKGASGQFIPAEPGQSAPPAREREVNVDPARAERLAKLKNAYLAAVAAGNPFSAGTFVAAASVQDPNLPA